MNKVNHLTDKEKAICLFEYIKELNRLKQKVILNVRDHPCFFTISELPDFPEYIKIYYCDRLNEENEENEENIDDILLSIQKPEFEDCPLPDAIFTDWLLPGWMKFESEVKVKEKIKRGNPEKYDFQRSNGEKLVVENVLIERFDDNIERVNAYKEWLEKRDIWVDRQKIIEKTQKWFAILYDIYFELLRNSETEEIIVANGMLIDNKNSKIKHPILTHRVRITYDATKNVIAIRNTEDSSKLYSELFQEMEDINLVGINQLNDDLHSINYHPLDRNDTPIFLRKAAQLISADSSFSTLGIEAKGKNRLFLYTEPCYIVRKRLDSVSKAIERIIENIGKTDFLPGPISDIVSGGKIDLSESKERESIEEQLAAVGGESLDVLLSKEANKEQLEIARRIEKKNVVLVQGPPGTGKTHTIANLLGHFLAQGKSVLVTSYTQKALRVLKEQVVQGLQNLCVSVLDDSKMDIEYSVDGITEYISKATYSEMERDIYSLERERNEVMHRLADVRRTIFSILHKEYASIIYNGEGFTPSYVAKFVSAHVDDLSYIPGKVSLNKPLPLTVEQLMELYRSNAIVSVNDEEELLTNLPNPDELLSPTDFERVCAELSSMKSRLQQLKENERWTVKENITDKVIDIEGANVIYTVQATTCDAVKKLEQCLKEFSHIEPWMKDVIIAGKDSGPYLKWWETLMKKIETVCDCADDLAEKTFGVEIIFDNPENASYLKKSFESLKKVINDKGKVTLWTRLFHKDYIIAQESVKINGKVVQSSVDCDLVLQLIRLIELRKQCAVYWDKLLSNHGVPKFFELDSTYPEYTAKKWIPNIKKYLDWYAVDYQKFYESLLTAGFDVKQVFGVNISDFDQIISKVNDVIEEILPKLCEACSLVLSIDEREKLIDQNKRILLLNQCKGSYICKALVCAMENDNFSEYMKAFSTLEIIYEKYAVQEKREKLLRILTSVAPQWADAIRNRVGIHGMDKVPDTIEEAWKWKQFFGVIEEITKQPLEKLQADSLKLSQEYRSVTAKYAEKCAWYHLMHKTEADIDMKQALQGWKQTVKRIGKGTGKNASRLKEKARMLMVKCQQAVPCWVMPINRALESLDPRENRFDVIIIDEASQADISALAILYMGKKLIIVGDDKQVSPMAVGLNMDKTIALETMYLKDKIPNSHLYTAKMSIYDIAATTFQPLMLREHFRCVPDIIGFSNMLSYDYKIKPLRDSGSSVLLPAVVNYRVDNGYRSGKNKTNDKEAEAIVALIKACIEQKEYEGKTFGIISLLGDEQVKVIQRKIEQDIDVKEIFKRRILCGNSANFQGDERDVIFLSLVDSGTGEGPLPMKNFGADDTIRKRYNVAVSRAKDQLWVVNSLDAANDLKAGDIRKCLIDYASNPHAIDIRHEEIEEQSESPFESAVAKNLSDRGYHIIQQRKVGAYRLDIVAVCGEKTVAIECDGERWHSGEEKIRADMERQTILERLGWRFIRIRGSEYYCDKKKTMERVVSELTAFGIVPESVVEVDGSEPAVSELLNRVKLRAMQLMEQKQEKREFVDIE